MDCGSGVELSALGLVREIIRAEVMDDSAKSALQALGSRIVFIQGDGVESKAFTFWIPESTGGYKSNHFFQLDVIKGSVYTFIWSTFARFDDEYILSWHCHAENYTLWHMKGVDVLNAKVKTARVDWFQLQSVQNELGIYGIGVSAFSKLLGRLLLSLPYFHRTGKYIAPMPASFM